MVSTSVSTITIYFSESYEISFNPSDKVSPSIKELRQVLLNDRKRMSALSQTVVGQHYSPRPCGASVFSLYDIGYILPQCLEIRLWHSWFLSKFRE